MPPRKSSRTKVEQPLPLVDCHIALSGTFPGTSQAAIQDQIVSCGASVSKSITDDTTHLVTSERDYYKPSTKVKAAQEHNLHIVTIEWIENCFSTMSRALETSYLFTSQPADVPSLSNGSQKRNASPDSSVDEKAKSRLKKQKTANGIKAEANDSETEVNDSKTKANGSKTKAKGSKTKANDSKIDDSKIDDSKTDVKNGKIADGQIVKSSAVKIPLDEHCHLYNYEVYIDDNGVIYDASLNQANATANNNKFYRLQVRPIPQDIFQILLTYRRFFKVLSMEITGPGADGAGLENGARAQLLATGL